MFKILSAVITILGQYQALEVKSLIQPTCYAVSTWEQVLSGSVAAKFSRASHIEWVSLSRDYESKIEDTLTSCKRNTTKLKAFNGSLIFLGLNSSSGVYNDIVLSLTGQFPPRAPGELYTKRTASDDMAHWQRRADCVCGSHLINGETTRTKGSSSWPGKPKTVLITVQIATTSYDFVPKNASMSQSNKTITATPSREPSIPMAFPQGSRTLY